MSDAQNKNMPLLTLLLETGDLKVLKTSGEQFIARLQDLRSESSDEDENNRLGESAMLSQFLQWLMIKDYD